MKRKTSSEIEYRDHKRARMEVKGDFGLEQPEIFGKIVSYLLYKPLNVINFARASKKLHDNLYNVVSWNQVGFNFLLSKNGRIDKEALTVSLQKIDNDRLVAKNIKIQHKIRNYTGIRLERGREASPMGGPGAFLSEATIRFQQLRLGINKNLPVDFYEKVLSNRILPESIVKAIANNINGEVKLVTEIFRAFEYVLNSSRADLEHEVTKNNNNVYQTAHREISSWGQSQPALHLAYVEEEDTNLLSGNTFIVCSAIDHDFQNNWDHRVILEFSCFFKYICDATKAVIFTTLYHGQNRIAVYWKVNLANKSVESSGSLHQLAKSQPRGNGRFSQVTRALLELFEIPIGDGVLANSKADEWLYNCGARAFVVQSLTDNNL